MRVSIHQPQYLPWLGLLHKIAQSDVFIFLDNVQFSKNWYQNRTTYSTAQGAKFLTIPVSSKGHIENQVEIRQIPFAEPSEKVFASHFETIRQRYRKSPGWKRHGDAIEALLKPVKPYATPCEAIIASMRLTMKVFGVEVKSVIASDLSSGGAKDELVLNLVKEVGGTRYLSGQGAKAYMREEIFTQAGVPIDYQEFQHPQYKQLHGGAFLDGCTALDLLLDDPETAAKLAESISRRD